MIPKEVYIALGAFLLLALFAVGVKVALDAQYTKGEAAGSSAATLVCSNRIDEIEAAADVERKRLVKISIDLGRDLARKDAQRRALAIQLSEVSDHEIAANPSPVGCAWSDERVRIINEAARGDGAGGASATGLDVPGNLPGSPPAEIGKP